MNLTPRQREVLSLIAAGMTAKQIARRLGVEYGTVRQHERDIFLRLGVHNRMHAALRFHGLLQ